MHRIILAKSAMPSSIHGENHLYGVLQRYQLQQQQFKTLHNRRPQGETFTSSDNLLGTIAVPSSITKTKVIRYTQLTKIYNSRDSLVVTHLTTSLPVHCLNMAERTGSLAFSVLWSYMKGKRALCGKYRQAVLLVQLYMGQSAHNTNTLKAVEYLLNHGSSSCTYSSVLNPLYSTYQTALKSFSTPTNIRSLSN